LHNVPVEWIDMMLSDVTQTDRHQSSLTLHAGSMPFNEKD